MTMAIEPSYKIVLWSRKRRRRRRKRSSSSSSGSSNSTSSNRSSSSRRINSRPGAVDGQQCPCPASVGLVEWKLGSGPKGDRVL